MTDKETLQIPTFQSEQQLNNEITNLSPIYHLGSFVYNTIDKGREMTQSHLARRALTAGGSVLAIGGPVIAVAHGQESTGAVNQFSAPTVYPDVLGPSQKPGCAAASKTAKSKVSVFNSRQAKVNTVENYTYYSYNVQLTNANKDMKVKVGLSIPMIRYNKSAIVDLMNCNERPRVVGMGGKIKGDGDPSTPPHRVPGGRQTLTVTHGNIYKYVKNSRGKKVKKLVPNVIYQKKYTVTVP